MGVMILLQILQLIGLVTFSVLVTRYLPSYVAEKGKNLATKEDVSEITDKIEGVKIKHAEALEAIRAAVGSRAHIYQFRYEREFTILLELTEKLVELRDATTSLRPESEYINPNETEDERKRKRLKRYSEAARALYTFVETRRPFFPEDLYVALTAVDQAAWREVVQFKGRTPDNDPKYWDNALESQSKIQELAEAALSKIRDRVRKWESFDPGPDAPA